MNHPVESINEDTASTRNPIAYGVLNETVERTKNKKATMNDEISSEINKYASKKFKMKFI
jgi:hypothetical protein